MDLNCVKLGRYITNISVISSALRLMTSYVNILCRLFATAYYAVLRNRALVIKGFMSIIDIISSKWKYKVLLIVVQQ